MGGGGERVGLIVVGLVDEVNETGHVLRASSIRHLPGWLCLSDRIAVHTDEETCPGDRVAIEGLLHVSPQGSHLVAKTCQVV